MARSSRSRSGPIGRLAYQPAADEGLVSKTLEFVHSQLPAWRDDPNRPKDSSEKRLNSSLCDFLDNRARSNFPMVRFKHEAPQTESRTVDIGVHSIEESTTIGAMSYSIYEPFLVVEAKRLPAPSADREREYVTGTNRDTGGATGGIQRFKLGQHGAQVETAAIVGYIEQKSPQHWIATINQWIAELTRHRSADACNWTQADKLRTLICDDEQATAKAESVHRRDRACVTQSIQLYHLWVVMGTGRE